MSTATVQTRASNGADVLDVNVAQRIVTVCVVPYETPTLIAYRGETWREVFAPTAFDNLDASRAVRVNREHDRARTVGKVISFNTGDPRGLIADIQIARTALGDETLQLAAEDCLSASIGFGVTPRGVITNHTNRSRRIIDAVLDHVSLVEAPAYDGARVLAVRSATPHLDAVARDPMFAWAALRSDPTQQWARQRCTR